MKIFVSQIYIEAGIAFSFSHHFQVWISDQFTSRVKPSKEFIEVYGEDYNIIFRMSAKTKITRPQIKGPSVFKKTKDVEYAIFLPHGGGKDDDTKCHEKALDYLFESIVSILESLGIDATNVVRDSFDLIGQIIANPAMLNARKSI